MTCGIWVAATSLSMRPISLKSLLLHDQVIELEIVPIIW